MFREHSPRASQTPPLPSLTTTSGEASERGETSMASSLPRDFHKTGRNGFSVLREEVTARESRGSEGLRVFHERHCCPRSIGPRAEFVAVVRVARDRLAVVGGAW